MIRAMVERSPRKRKGQGGKRVGRARRISRHPPPAELALGPRIRELRKAQGLGLVAVAERSGLSLGLISQIERGLTSPSMRSLRQIARALGIQVERLFMAPPAPDPDEALNLVRAEGRRILDLAHTGIHIELVTPPEFPGVQAFCAYIRPGGASGPEFDSHVGKECGIVVSGQFELWLGNRHYMLGPGDSFSFDSETPHRYRNPGATMTCIHWVISPPIY
jgi:transcriptional regulator with XRE-family HTH domain